MPAGPAGDGTLLFTQCWGIAAESDAQEQAVELVNYLTAPTSSWRSPTPSA